MDKLTPVVCVFGAAVVLPVACVLIALGLTLGWWLLGGLLIVLGELQIVEIVRTR